MIPSNVPTVLRATILERLGCAAVVFRVEEGRDREEMARELAEAVDG